MSDSLITKKAMADSLKSLMGKKNLEKITVSDIVHNCGLNRQTFYYHFKDKYDLVNWIYYNEIVSTLEKASDSGNWSSAMLEVLSIMKREKVFYIGSLNMDCQNIFYSYLFNATKSMLLKIINQVVKHAPSKRAIEPVDRIFIAEFYTYGLVGMVIQWAKKGMKEPPADIVSRLDHFIDDSKRVSAILYLKEKEQQEGKAPEPPSHSH